MTVSILGAGAWGSALALHMAKKRTGEILLWSRGAILPPSLQNSGVQITPTANLFVAAQCDEIVIATPAQSLRDILSRLAPYLRSTTSLICAAKGIEQGSGLMLSDVAYSVVQNPFFVLSGPSFAEEVARGLPTALTLAGSDQVLLDKIADRLAAPEFRIYKSDDLIGVQLGGAIKNVIAIAAGIVIGAGLGENARAALMTRGLAETMRLAHALGARRETLMGLSGLGDLALTCGSEKSRNFSYGLKIGQGASPDAALGGSKGVVEGAYTADAVLKLAHGFGVELPICAAVNDIVQGRLSVREAMNNLLLRPLTTEI